MKSKLTTTLFLSVILAAGLSLNALAAKSATWRFEASNSAGESKRFGPFTTKVICIEARNREARQVKWILITDCHQ